MHAVIFLPAAQTEASEAQDWYEARPAAWAVPFALNSTVRSSG